MRFTRRWRFGIAAAALTVGTASAGSLKFKSDDGSIAGEFGGRVIVHGRFFTESNPKEDSFYFKELFLDTKGKIHKVFEYKVEGNFGTNGSASLADGWLAWKMHELFRVQFGQFKLPVLFEQVLSSSTSSFPERPLIDRLAPGRDIGFMVDGEILEDKALVYAVGMSNGRGSNAQDSNDSKDVFGRVGARVFKLFGVDEMGDLQLAISGTHGEQNGTGALSDVSDPSTGTTVVDYSGSSVAAGPRDRLGYEVLWSGGPASVTFEYLRQDQTVQRQFAGDPVIQRDGFKIDAWYLGGTWFLTGEEKKLGSLPKVKNPVHEGGLGAFELAVRYGVFNPSEKLVMNLPTRGYADPNFTASKVTEFFVGVNYYPANDVRFTLSYVTNDFEPSLDEGSGGDTQGSEGAIMTRMQIMF